MEDIDKAISLIVKHTTDTDLRPKLQMVFTYHVDGKLVVTPRFVKVGEVFDDGTEFTEPTIGEWRTLDIDFQGVHIEDDLLWAGFNEIIRMYSITQNAPPKGKAVLRIYDGLGNFLEEWIMHDAYPTAVEMKDLNAIEIDIHLGLKYKYHTFRCGIN